MTRRILLMRHAKSDWSDESLRDHDRPLNARGARDAPRMGRLLDECGLAPSLVICSTAVRAVETARLVLDAMEDDSARVDFAPELYHATPEEIAAVVDATVDPGGVTLVVGHNPGLEELLGRITGLEVEMPTAAIAAIECGGSLAAAFDAPGRLAVLVEHWRPRHLGRG